MKFTDDDSALIIIDVQKDFCKDGALAVPDGDAIVPVVNKYIKLFSNMHLPILASRDWHPRNSHHFEINGGRWPEHCVQNTEGAKFHSTLDLPEDTHVISSGTGPFDEGYSIFEGKDAHNVSFSNLLDIKGIKKLFICGLATDYCVKESALDALKHGLIVYLLADAVKGIDVTPGDSQKAINEIKAAGGTIINLHEII